MCYQSCLSDEALDIAVADYLDVLKRQEEQAREKQEYLEGFNARKEQAQNAGEPFEEEERQWEEIEARPFSSFEEKYVVMLDTLGQDRQFTPDEKRFILNAVQRFTQLWEQQEVRSLTMDRDAKLELIKADKMAIAEVDATVMEDIEKKVEHQLAERHGLDDEEIRDITSKEIRLQEQAKHFIEKEEWRVNIEAI